MSSAAERPASDAVVKSEDTTEQGRTARQRTAPAVPRGEGLPSGHGRVHEAPQPDAVVLGTAR